MLIVIVQNDIMLSVIMLIVVVLSIILLSVFLLSVVKLSVIIPHGMAPFYLWLILQNGLFLKNMVIPNLFTFFSRTLMFKMTILFQNIQSINLQTLNTDMSETNDG